MTAHPLREAFGASPMTEGEMLARAREAYIDECKPWRWRARRIRSGAHDKRLSPILAALRLAHVPFAAIEARRDEATVALILRTTPNLEASPAVIDALATAVRMGRRG